MLMPTCWLFLRVRRGEIAALRWRNVDLSAGRLAVVDSVEQTQELEFDQGTQDGQGAHRCPIDDRDRGIVGLAGYTGAGVAEARRPARWRTFVCHSG